MNHSNVTNDEGEISATHPQGGPSGAAPGGGTNTNTPRPGQCKLRSHLANGAPQPVKVTGASAEAPQCGVRRCHGHWVARRSAMSHTSGRPPYYGVHLGAVLLAVAVLLCSRLQGVSAADRPTDRDISALDRVCMPRGIPYLTIGCRTGNQHRHYSVCEVDGVVRYGDVAGREVTAYGLMHNCAPTHVRAPGRGYAQVAGWKPGPAGITSATEPGGRVYACGYENSDSLATGGELKERPRPVSALSIAPWGVRDSVGRSREYWLNETHSARDYHRGGSADQWSGRSYCDRAGLATLVYLCDFGRGDELLHFCNDRERGWWYDLFGNQMAVDVGWCACRAVGIRVPPGPYRPESSGRGLPKRRVVPAADYSPSRVEPGRLSFGYGPQTAWDNYSPHRTRGIAWNLHQSGKKGPLPMSATDLSDAGRNLTMGVCTRSGEGYVVWRCHQGRGRHYVVTCGTGADTTLDGSAGGSGEGIGVTRGCSPVNVGAPNRGPQVGPASPWANTFHWNNYPAGYNAECAPLRRDPHATGRRARSPTRAEVAALAIPPWGVRNPTGLGPGTYDKTGKATSARTTLGWPDRWTGRSYCDRRGLPAAIYVCNAGGLELFHFCHDGERGWWYDLFGNQLADNRVRCFCHLLGVRVPGGEMSKDAPTGRRLPMRSPGFIEDCSPPLNEYSHAASTLGGRNWWARCGPLGRSPSSVS